MSDPVLTLDRVSVDFRTRAGTVRAVDDVSLALRPGESLGLVGESGCGKTTLAMAILRHFSDGGRLAAGRITFRNQDVAGMSAADLRRLRGGGIGIVYQEPMAALNPSLTIGEQLAEVVVAHAGAARAEARRQAAAMLADVRLPDPERVMRAYPHHLSGGQQQRAVIAMALLPRPAVLLLDEPTTGLDVTIEAGIVDLIAGISARTGTALLYISHNLGLLLRVCDRIAVMYAGRIVEQGPVHDVFRQRLHPYTRGLFACLPDAGADKEQHPLRPIRGTVPAPRERPDGCAFGPRCDLFQPGQCDAAPPPLSPATEAHAVACPRWHDPLPPHTLPAPHQAAEGAGVILEARGLSKSHRIVDRSMAALFGDRPRRRIAANDALDLTATGGQTLAIVGESGCGKTTFARVVMGLDPADAGSLLFGGTDIAQRATVERDPTLLRAVQMVFQNPDETLNPSFAVGRQIARVVRRFGIATGRAAIAARVDGMMEAIRLPLDIAARRPGQLSGGQKQRIAIARAFIGDPILVIADEPVSALDVSVRAAVVELLLDLQRARGTTLVVISHDLGLVRYIADHVAVMYLGRIMEAGPVARVFAPPFHPYTEALLAAAPVADPDHAAPAIRLGADLPNPADPPRGCPFHTRCPRKIGAICETERPPERHGPEQHRIACHIPMPEFA